MYWLVDIRVGVSGKLLPHLRGLDASWSRKIERARMPYTPRSGGGRGVDMAQAGVFSTAMRRYGMESESFGDYEAEWDVRNESDDSRWWRRSGPMAGVGSLRSRSHFLGHH